LLIVSCVLPAAYVTIDIVSSQISHGYALPQNEHGWRELARSVLDRKPKSPSSYVGASVALAQLVETMFDRRQEVIAAIEAAACAENPEDKRRAIERVAELVRSPWQTQL
jgi:hypothetical protein